MKKIMALTLAVSFITVIFTGWANDGTSAKNNNMKKVVVAYMEKNVRIEGKEIIFSYYDETTLTRIIKQEKTNVSGKITFLIPGSNNGASSIFSIAFDEKNISRARAFRIPPDSIFGGQDSVSISVENGKKCFIQNVWAPIQWVDFPKDGSKISIDQSNIYILRYNEPTKEATDIRRMSFVNGQMKQIGPNDIFLEGSSLDILK